MTLPITSRIASVVNLIFLSGFLTFFVPSALHAAATAIVVMPFEIERGSVVPGAPQKLEVERQRLVMIAERLREAMRASGHFEVIDVAPVAAEIEAVNLQACGNCAGTFALRLGSNFAVTGLVQKVSELILSINVHVLDARNATRITGASVDLRGNTDESWRRGIDYLWQHVLSKRMGIAVP